MSLDNFRDVNDSIRVDFDRNGPRIGAIPLVERGIFGFVPRSSAELEKIFFNTSTEGIDIHRLQSALASVALALNKGDLGLAAVAASRLPLPPRSPTKVGALH